ncbi:N-acyl-D-amino-acid deacylase family protein [Leeia aquatica]|uniref:D-aminoacylase n=1 Tax=Leeia aquatica TaxID=2725557 RepID=A0A847SD01_9NEIS|nr:D-aminoacylase [Leeia aquatica]NLR76805.1 D-aminoacylase [Leeia aquatica]
MTTPIYDTVLHGGTLLDGSATPGYQADIGIQAGRIAAIAPAGSLHGQQQHDASGWIISPGFIDVHAHDDQQAVSAPAMQAKLTQGVTTVVVGNCGISLVPWVADRTPPAPLNLIGSQADYCYPTVAAYAAAVDAAGPTVNIGLLVGHSTLRVNVLDDPAQAASAAQVEQMQALLEEGMQSGALGFSSGLFYPTSKIAGNDEVIALAKVAARHGGVYTSHIRDEYAGVIDSIHEACDAGEAAGLQVVLSHHKCAGPANWGRSNESLACVTERRRRHPVGLDAYPYTAGSTTLNPDYVDGKIKVLVSWSEPHPEHNGRDLAEVAAEWGVDQKEAARRLSPAGGIYFQMHEDDVRRILAYPHTMIGSDGLPRDAHPHPRLWGAFPRVLGHYCREEKLFHLPEAIRRMTTLSADTFGLRRRGRLQVGCAADLVVFSPAHIRDTATFADPKQPAQGIHQVWVNGVLSVIDGVLTGQRGGRMLRRQQERFDEGQP